MAREDFLPDHTRPKAEFGRGKGAREVVARRVPKGRKKGENIHSTNQSFEPLSIIRVYHVGRSSRVYFVAHWFSVGVGALPKSLSYSCRLFGI